MLSLVSESGLALDVIEATFSGAPVMKAPTLMVQSTDAPAARAACVQVTVPLASVQSAAAAPPKLANETSGGSWSVR